VHAPAPAAGSPTEEQETTGRGAGENVHGASAPAARATVAESLADIRADRIIADARRDAQAIVDTARVDARREARAIVDSARSEAETIITEAFEQRARIVRRDWAIGDGSWATAGADDEGTREDDHEDDHEETAAAAVETEAGVPTPAEGMPVPVADAVNEVDDPPAPLPDVAPHPAPDVAPHPVPDVAAAAGLPEPDVAAAARLPELIELPALRARDRFMATPPRAVSPHEPRPPLPARPRRGAPPLPRGNTSAPPPPPPPPPAPPAPAPTRSRPRPRIERELPAGMRIPPDVPDWDDDYDDAEDR